jgi:outer membrane lipoprotein SlyB
MSERPEAAATADVVAHAPRPRRPALRRTFVALVVALASATAGCATTESYSTTWGQPTYVPVDWVRHGRVESVREDVQRQVGHPGAGAVAGGFLGALLGWRGPAVLFGAASGALIGAAVSQGGGERRTYTMTVRFDDGGAQSFVYPGPPPFRPGDPVALTARGLAAG